MKYLSIILSLFIPALVSAQKYSPISNTPVYSGYRPSGLKDTVAAIIIYSPCDSCPVISGKALAVRELYTFSGDNMFGQKPTWRQIELLAPDKKPFPKSFIIWQSKLIEP